MTQEKNKKEQAKVTSQGKQVKKKIDYMDSDLPLDVKMEGWIGRHWKQVLLFSLGIVFITIVWSSYNISGLREAVREQAKAMEHLAKRVIVSAPDGRVVILETSPIPDSHILLVLRDLVSKYLVYSSFEINSLRITDIKGLENVDKVKVFAREYCGTQDCIRQFEAFLTAMWKAYKDGTLPEVVYVGGVGEERIKVEGGKFYYAVNLPLITYTVKEGRWNRGDVRAEFVLEGEINLAKNSPYNPWGIKIARFKATLPTL